MTTASVEENVLESNGVSIHFARIGDPGLPSLLLIHGIYDQWESWAPVIDHLASEYYLIAVDLRGHGRSDKPDSGYEMTDYAADIAGLLRALNLGQVFVAGHSLGALTAMSLAVENPELIRGVVLEDPPTEFRHNTGSRMKPLLDAKRSSDEDAYNLFREMNPSLGEERWRDQARRLRNTADGPFEAVLRWDEPNAGPDIFGALEAILCPVLLVQADPMAGSALSDASAEQAILLLRHGELRKFNDTGHSIHKERPDEFAGLVLEFLARFR